MSGLLRRLLALWVRFRVLPEDVAAKLAGSDLPVCYVLERCSPADLAVLQQACLALRLPRPGKRLLGEAAELRSCFALSRTRGMLVERLDRRPPPQLSALIGALQAEPQLDVLLVPVAVFWGRAPHRDRSLLGLLLGEDWTLASRLRRVLQVLLNGGNTLVEFEAPLSLRALLGEEVGVAARGRRVARTLRAVYAAQRTARIGPDLSHRRTIVTDVLRTRAVRAAVAQEMREKHCTRRQALLRARRLVLEIAANYSPAFVRLMDRALGRLWNRLFDGVEVAHVATLAQVTQGHEVIYVPCHRSHMDYLLLSYAIYTQGYAIPHIAAGINLDLPVVGRFLRMGGAFFIRRSFRGSALYAVVFSRYLAAIMARGHPIEYFIEGGRSRTGRLLQPKTGMLSMTVRSYLRQPVRPVVFVPVYFGYDAVAEGSTYVGELSGKPKEKETVLGLVRSLRRLRQRRFGRVHVNFGEPILLESLLERHEPGWRSAATEEEARLPWLPGLVDELALTIMRNINGAAAVSPVSLIAAVLLATPRRALGEVPLRSQLELYRALLRSYSCGGRVTVTGRDAASIVDYGLMLGIITRQAHPLGDVIRMSEASAVLATYHRNNVLHLLAMPALIACVFVSNARVSTPDLQRLAWRIYPYIAAELFLPWEEAQVPALIEALLAALGGHGLLQPEVDGSGWRRPDPDSLQAMQLSLLAQTSIEIIERYYLVIALLMRAGSGTLTQVELEERCRLTAQRIALLYGLESPEFSHRMLFTNFIDLLRQRGVVRTARSGRLEYDAVLAQVAADAQFVLSEQIRHSILQVTHS